MSLDIQFEIKKNPYYISYLRENSIWYKYLNRNPKYFKEFEEKAKEFYKLRPSDRINKMFETFELITNIVSTLK